MSYLHQLHRDGAAAAGEGGGEAARRKQLRSGPAGPPSPPCDQPSPELLPDLPLVRMTVDRSSDHQIHTYKSRRETKLLQKNKKKKFQQFRRAAADHHHFPLLGLLYSSIHTLLLLHHHLLPPLGNGVRWPLRPGRELRGTACRGRECRCDCWRSDTRSYEQTRAQSHINNNDNTSAQSVILPALSVVPSFAAVFQLDRRRKKLRDKSRESRVSPLVTPPHS